MITGSKDTPPKMAEIDTVESYDGDFTLRLEFRASRDANSGLHLRDKAFAHQLQIRDYPAGRPVQDAQGLQGRRLERDRGGRHRHQGPLHLQRRAARSRPRDPRQGAARPAIRDQRGRIPEHPGQEGGASAQEVKRDIPYATPAQERQVLDVYSPPGAKDLPVVFWIHGGGWQAGDKSERPDQAAGVHGQGVRLRLHQLPAPAARRHGDHRARHRQVDPLGARPHRRVRGRPAAPPRHGPFRRRQLAALVCIDDRYLKAEGLSLAIIKGCVPVDGDTYDVPAIIETAETRRRVHGLPQATYGHREKFGNDPAKHRDFSAVTHVARDKGIPPFLIMHVAEHPDTSAQAQRLAERAEGRGRPGPGLRRPGIHPQQDQRGPRPARRSRHEGVVRVRRRGAEEVNGKPEVAAVNFALPTAISPGIGCEGLRISGGIPFAYASGLSNRLSVSQA